MESSTVNAGQPACLFDHAPNQEWARRIARTEWRGLPPSFALEDLEQEALIALWKQSQRYDPARKVPFQAFAYLAVKGAVLMACRRRHYKEATHEELKPKHYPLDARPDPERELIEQAVVSGEENIRDQRRPYRRKEVVCLLEALPAADAFVVKRAVIEGIPVEALAKLWGTSSDRMRRRLKNAVQMLRKASKERSKR